MSSSKTAKMGLSKENLNQIINALGTAVLYKLINGAVTIGGETTNLTELKAAVDQAVGSVENKVEPDDICPELRAGYAFTADNLNATKGLTVNDDPMSFGVVGGAQKSAVGDGNASLNKLVCVDVVRNQYVKPRSGSIGIDGADNCSLVGNGDGTLTLTVTDTVTTDGVAYIGNAPKEDGVVSGELYFFYGGKSPLLAFGYGVQVVDTGGGAIGVCTFNESISARIEIKAGLTAGIYTLRPIIVRLKQRYGSNDVVNAIIGATASEQVARLLAFDPEILKDLSYDTGTMVPSKTAKLLPVGVNQWDEEWELGSINATTGEKESDSSRIRNKNPIKVLPNTVYYKLTGVEKIQIFGYDLNMNYIGVLMASADSGTFTTPANCYFINFRSTTASTTTYSHDICINVSDPNINGNYYPSKRNPVTLPNYEGHGILTVVDGKVVAAGDELYPDGNSKKRYETKDFTSLTWYKSGDVYTTVLNPQMKAGVISAIVTAGYSHASSWSDMSSTDKTWYRSSTDNNFYVHDSSGSPSGSIVYLLDAETDITTPVFQSTFPVEQGGTLQFLDEDDNPIAGLQGSEIFYQKNLKAFTEAMGEAVDWDPERIARLGNLSFTPEYVDITLNPSPTGAYARAQVYNATFTIVISAALTGTANGSITFQDSEVDLSNFQTEPAKAIYDMDGKKVSEAPTTADCNIASFVGRSKSGVVLWSLLHSGVNKVKIHIEEAVPLDSEGNGKIDCRASLIL